MAQIPVFVAVSDAEAKAKLQALIAQTNAASGAGSRLGGVLGGIGAGLGIAGVVGVSGAVRKLTDVLGDAVSAAMEDERSIVRLNVSLRDNVAAWDGNTAAIESALSARMRFGFADEVLRQSLGTLVAATHDVSEGLRLQTLAMDLARFRGIDLADATDAVAKAASGSMRSLNAMIPATRGAKTAAEALARAFQAVSGQAEEFAASAPGKVEAASVKMGESLERLGKRILPAVADGATIAADGIDLVSFAMYGWGEAIAFVTGGPARDYVNATAATRQETGLAHDALTQYTGAVDISAAHMVPASSAAAAFAGRLGQVRDTAFGAWDALRRLHLEMGSGAVPVTVLANGMTAYGQTVSDVTRANSDAVLKQRDYLAGLKDTTRSLGGASRAARDFTAVVGKAFDALRTKVLRALDDIHEANVRAIEETRRLANEPLLAEMGAIDAQVAAARRALDDARDARRKAELEAEVAQAQSVEDRASAQQALDDFLADQRLKALEDAAEARQTDLQKQIDANDATAEAATTAEEARYKAQQAAFEKDIAALETHLKAKKTTWDKANKELLTLLDKYGVDFEGVGLKMGTKYATGYTKGVNSAIKSIAAAVAKLLGLDEQTIHGLSTAGGAGNTAAAATAAAGGAVAMPTSPTAPTATATGTAPTTAGGGGGNSFTVVINAGAFTGTEADARRFAAQMWQSFRDETVRRRDVWPAAAEWDKVRKAAGV